jgi:uncharacterized protein YndB with AHSA1/START domain
MRRDLHFEIDYPHPPEKVWQALTDPVAIAEWLMPNNFEPQAGHKFQFRTHPAPGFNGIIDSEVVEVDPPRRLVYTWSSGKLNTLVIWTLQATKNGTLLTLGQGWRSKKLARTLPAYLERAGTPSTP